MTKFKVIALSVGGKGNQVFKAGDVVSSDNFNDAKALVDGGFLAEISELKKVAPKAAPKKSNKKSK